MNFRLQSYGLALVAIVLLLAVAWGGFYTWRELVQLHRSFTAVQADDFYMATHIEDSVYELNRVTLNALVYRNAADATTFQKKGQELEQWIQMHQAGLTTAEQRQLITLIKSELAVYLSSNAQLINNELKSQTMHPAVWLLEQRDKNAGTILVLCAELKTSEQAEQIQFINDSRRAVDWLQDLFLASVLFLSILIIGAMLSVHRGVVGPLQIELVKSRIAAMRNEKLVSLGTLAAGVAHEIRNPLTAINVRLHSLKKGLVANSSEQEDAVVIGNEIQRLERIVQEFLQFARPAEPKFLDVSMDSLFSKVRTLLGAQLERNTIELSLESVPDIWVRVDPQQIEQVLINLVQNAAESIECNGKITLRTEIGKARLMGIVKEVIIIRVIDTGKGIPPEVQKRMFDPFYTTKPEGAGLGLGIAARIIEKHNGTIECYSEANRGATFTILLPYTPPKPI